MYHGAGDPRSAQRSREVLAPFSAEATARTILTRLRKLLDAFTPGMPVDRARLPESLASPLQDAQLERERLFALGWLHWLNEEPTAAEPLLIASLERAQEQKANEAVAEAAYWIARIRLLMERSDALTEYEPILRSLGGSPRATAWFVDLLGRAGRLERAEQVWKSVRGNRRVIGCAEGALLEARMLLRRGESATAERLLREASPTSGVVWVEEQLLLAWIAANQHQADRARQLLRQAAEGPYPASALRDWSAKIEHRLSGESGRLEEKSGRVPAALREWLQGQQARREGRIEDAMSAYRPALHSPPAQPFARYALACLEQDDVAALLAAQPGLFLAVRCRARLAAERFRLREASAAEFLEALRLASVHGYQDAAAEQLRTLAEWWQDRQPDPAKLHALAAEPCADAAARNRFRTALELAVRRLPDAAKRALLLDWAKRTDLPDELRTIIGRQLLRLLLLASEDEELRSATAVLLPDEPLLLLTRSPNPLEATSTDALPPPTLPAGTSPAVLLWRASCHLDPPSTDSDRWRAEVRELRSQARWKGFAQALLLYEAAQRGDAEEVLSLMEAVDAWRGFHTPPGFVLHTLEAVAAAHPHHPGWRRGLTRWLQLWDRSSLGTQGTTLAALAGLMPTHENIADPPTGAPTVPWLLHQASRALGREDAVVALAFARRALAHDPDLASIPNAALVNAALPELELRARAQRLAAMHQHDEIAAGVLVDAVEALQESPEGAAVLDALDASDVATARVRLETMSEANDLSPRLAHHLGLLMQRAAHDCETQDDSASAESCWRRAWRCWLLGLSGADRRIVLDHLLEKHRHRVNDALARNAVDGARRYWNLVRDLPTLAARIDDSLGRELGERVEQFRDELATEYLLTTREAMRFGVVPEGQRADYEKGLTYLRRLLSLDRDNLRLLATLVEICNDWFLDLYHQNDTVALQSQLERFTPFALQLARRIDERPGDLHARAAVSDFWKFRGFLATDREQKVFLYREALRFNPTNNNVRDLLAQLTSE